MQRLNGVSSEKVKAATGRDWAEWVQFLDGKQASELDHPAIVALVFTESPRPWWAQMVSVGYEQAKGKRVKNQTVEGFQIGISKSFEAPISKVYKAWDEFLEQWYDGPEFTITTNNQDKNLRGKFDDGTIFEAQLLTTKTGKTQLTVDVNKLESATAAEAARTVWKRQLEQLAKYLG